MMKMFRMGVAALAALVVGGCATFQYEGESFEKHTDRVLVFNSTQGPVKSMWHVVGYGAIRQRANWCSDQSLIDAMRLEAAEHGANAIHITSIRVIPVDPESDLPISTAEVETTMGDPDQQGMAVLQSGFGLPEDGYPSNYVPGKDDPQKYVRVLRAEFLRLNDQGEAPVAPVAPAAAPTVPAEAPVEVPAGA